MCTGLIAIGGKPYPIQTLYIIPLCFLREGVVVDRLESPWADHAHERESKTVLDWILDSTLFMHGFRIPGTGFQPVNVSTSWILDSNR